MKPPTGPGSGTFAADQTLARDAIKLYRPRKHEKNEWLRRAWRGPGFEFDFSPAHWMSDEELEEVARRVPSAARDIAHWVRLSQLSKEFLEALRVIATDKDNCTCASRSWFGEGHDSACPIEIAQAAFEIASSRLNGDRQPNSRRPSTSGNRTL